jgi:hypothetical protein
LQIAKPSTSRRNFVRWNTHPPVEGEDADAAANPPVPDALRLGVTAPRPGVTAPPFGVAAPPLDVAPAPRVAPVVVPLVEPAAVAAPARVAGSWTPAAGRSGTRTST